MNGHFLQFTDVALQDFSSGEEFVFVYNGTLHHLHPAQGQCCFLSGSWPDERSQNDDLDTFQTHAGTTPSENTHPHRNDTFAMCRYMAIKDCGWVYSTSLGKLLLEKTLRGQDRWWCLEIQLRIFSHSAVPLGGGPSSLCSNTSCFWARTALPSNIRSNYRWRRAVTSRQPPLSSPQKSIA